MKIAVCYRGHLRTLSQTFENQKNNLFFDHEVDFFCHTWNEYSDEIEYLKNFVKPKRILVEDIIEESIPLENANTIIFHAYDGYTTSLSIDYVKNNDILLAFNMNNVTLPPERGWPFQLVAESKWGYKWIKWVTEIELSDNEDYEGYWESRGYSNNADLNKSFFD